MHNIDEEYRKLLMDILIHGIKKEDITFISYLENEV
jgi:hypothetical protein